MSPHVTLSPKGIVVFLASLNDDWVRGVTSLGILKVALELVLDTRVPFKPFTLITAPSPILDPVIVSYPPL